MGALGLRELLVGGRDQQDPVHAVERRAEGLGPQHVALDELHRGKRLQLPRPRTVAHQCPDWLAVTGEFVDRGGSVQAGRAGDEDCHGCAPPCRVGWAKLADPSIQAS